MTVDEIYQFFGSIHKAIKVLGITKQGFAHWQKKGYVPIYRQKKIELITKGALKADGEQKEINSEPELVFLPIFRFYDKKYGLCDVEAIHFRNGKTPRIIYKIEGKKKSEKFSAFNSENLMQGSKLVDRDGKIVYEGDVLQLNKGKKFTFESIEMTNQVKRLGKFKIIGNIFE